MNDEERERERAEIKALGDLTDPKNNPLIPGDVEDPIVGDLTDPKQNELISPDAYQHLPGRTNAPSDRPSVESLEEILAKFIEGSSASEYERLKALFKL